MNDVRIWDVIVPPQPEDVREVFDRNGHKWVRPENRKFLWMEESGGELLTWHELVSWHGPVSDRPNPDE